jgi:hypothetical protein
MRFKRRRRFCVQVAVLCNHQRAVPKTHEKSMQKMLDNIKVATEAYEDLKKQLANKLKGRPQEGTKNVSEETCASIESACLSDQNSSSG